MEQELRQNLIDAAAELKALVGVSEQTIGQMAIKDNTFFSRIKGEGRPKPAGFTVKTYDRVMEWMRKRKEDAVRSSEGEAA